MRCSTPSSGSSAFLAVSRQQVEAELRVEHFRFQLLEREHADGLLPQFVEAALAALAGWLENVHDGAPHRSRFGRAVSSIASAMAAGCAIT